MRVSATEEYGLRCLLTLARAGKGKQMSISDIAEAEGISVPYASKLLSMLRKTELVAAERGRNGGFWITRKPSEINLHEVIIGLGGPLIDPDHCSKMTGNQEKCVHGSKCSVHDVLGGLAGYVATFLMETTLQDLIDGIIPKACPPPLKIIKLDTPKSKKLPRRTGKQTRV
ncbi:MAG TPA: Rrf2 family transcriptional regulator [candidate division Zixibacteria bacterium]|nr:Rrf2 family transcriptional regulator [candidate division Zixibacteria bacterium]